MIKKLLALSLFQINASFCMHTNYGFMLTANCEINSNTFINEGTLNAANSARINVTNLSGAGTISCDDIQIKCTNFNYTGKIKCDGNCTIICPKEFDYNKFKRIGAGKFNVIISPNDIDITTHDQLLKYCCNQFCSNILNFDIETIDNKINYIKKSAYVSNINEKKLIEDLNAKIKQEIQRHERADLYGESPTEVVKVGSLGLASLAASILSYKYRNKIEQYAEKGIGSALSVIFGCVAVGAFFMLPDYINEWRNPKHAEKAEKLKLILAKVEKSGARILNFDKEIIRIAL